MKFSVLFLGSVTAALLFFTSCQKELDPLPPSSGSGDTTSSTTKWLLASSKYIPYDTVTGQVETGDIYYDSMLYSANRRELIIIEDGVPYEQYTYTANGLLSTIHRYRNNAWQLMFTFNRNSADLLVSTDYNYGNGNGTGFFKYGTSSAGKTIQFIDTAAGVVESGYYTVTFDNSGNAIAKNYAQKADGSFYGDWTDPVGNHTFAYDANNYLASLRQISGANAGGFKDTAYATFTRDTKANEVLLEYYKMLYGYDLYFWFTKYKIFYGNELYNADYTYGGGYAEGWFNFGKPCTKINTEFIEYDNFTNDRTVIKQEILFNNVYDTNGNLTSYTATTNGKVTEKWEFTYIKK